MSTNVGLVIFGDHSLVVEAITSLLQQQLSDVHSDTAMDVEDSDSAELMDEELETMVL
jgi:hypothetical protein